MTTRVIRSELVHLSMLALACCAAGVVSGREALVQGGVSPDGRLEIVLEQAEQASARPMAIFRRRADRAEIGRVFVGAHAEFDQARLPANTEALWSPDSRRVALKSCGGPGRTDVAIHEVGADAVSERPVADPFHQILVDYQASSPWKLARISPARWNPDGTLTLRIEGSCVPGDNFRSGRMALFEYEAIYDAATGNLLSYKKLRERMEARR